MKMQYQSRTLDTKKRSLLRELIKVMGENGHEPFEPLIDDGERHECQMVVDGITHVGFYQAVWNYMTNSTPTLFCTYGLNDGKESFTYSSNQ